MKIFNWPSYEELKEKFKQKIEPLRGTGYCIKCEKLFPDTEVDSQFRITNPITNEIKYSLLCTECRKKSYEQIRRIFGEIKEELK